MRRFFKSEFHGTKLTAERLRQVLSYAPDTGVFIWLQGGRGKYKRAGAVAGAVSRYGYGIICIDGTTYLAHRLAWLYMTGEWPDSEIDHIDGEKLNNRIANLRDVPRAINAQNIRAARSDSRSGILGVSWNADRGCWVASISDKRKPVHLGFYSDQGEAQAAYLEAKRRMHAGCTI